MNDAEFTGEESSLADLAGRLDEWIAENRNRREGHFRPFNKKLSVIERQAMEFFVLKNFVAVTEMCFLIIGRVSFSFKNLSAQIGIVTKCFEWLLQVLHEPAAAYDLKNKIYQHAQIEIQHSIRWKDQLESKWMQLLREASFEINEEEAFGALLIKNQDLDVFREERIRQLVDQKDFSAARDLISAPKKSGPKNSPKINLKNKEWLLQMAVEEKDLPSIRKLSEYLFKKTNYDMKYFFMLKKYSDRSSWKKHVQTLLNSIRRDQRFYEDKVRAQVAILLEENDEAQLLRLFELNTYLHLLTQYDHLLSKKFPRDLVFLYKEALERYAEQHLGQASYYEVLKILKRMLKLPGGKPVVQSLTTKFKVDYRKRRGMVKVLNELVV